MSVRAKLRLDSIVEHSHSQTARTLKFFTSYDNTIPEDQRFAKATPSGSMEMYVDNPSALEQFKLGESYYVDFTPAPKPAA